jgi:CBS domain-containing protein
MSLTAKDIMTRLVVTARADLPLDELVRTMRERELSGLPVVRPGGCLAGFVAQDDVFLRPSGADAGAAGGPVTAEEVMVREVITAREDTTVRDLAALMWKHRIHRVPVCDEERTVLGIVSSMDICRAIMEGKLG